MECIDYIIRKDLEPFVNCVMVGKNDDPKAQLTMPLYADGYPGIMFQQTEKGFFLQPKGKQLSELFLYGQTLDPISLEVQGPYAYVVFQLYPFASRYLLGIDPKELNDDCYDLLPLEQANIAAYFSKLRQTQDQALQVQIMGDLVMDLIQLNAIPKDDRIHTAISLILQHKGQVKIGQILDQLAMTERTLERNFMRQTGLRPKQFARIIQFQASLHQLNAANFNKLVEVGMDSGFADQSHFIRTFKSYTGQTPKDYLHQLSAI